jgi:uncharacterized RDD family membrane protein YckC
MTDPTLPPVSAPTEIPGQRSASDHPRRPDLPPPHAESSYATSVSYAPNPYDPGPPSVTTTNQADEAYAHWGLRVAAVLIDMLLQIPFVIAQFTGLVIAFEGGGLALPDGAGVSLWSNDTVTVTVPQMTAYTWAGLAIANIAGLAGFIFSVWNGIFRQGRRGASIGKQCMNLMVVSETDGRPIGALMTWVRQWVHLLDALILGIGYLWPLWDRKRQTFADMIMKTAVLHLPPLPPRTTARIPTQATAPHGW